MFYSSVFEVLLKQCSSVIDNQVHLLPSAWGVESLEIFICSEVACEWETCQKVD